jgi:diguanylate cyclase (GGDEF)-like protein
MEIPEWTTDEPIRLAALRSTRQLDTPIEERFESLTRMARRLLNVPIAAVSLVDTDRQWFKSISGLDADQTSRAVSFCGHTIHGDDVLIVTDARKDERFTDNPLVTDAPNIVFYAGSPIRSRCGSNIASFCVIDNKPRHLTGDEIEILRDLAALAAQQLDATIRQTVEMELIDQIKAERREKLVDPLTRLWNRRGLDELLNSHMQQAATTGTGTALIVADLDHFKQINDTHGHTVGDEVLREVGKRLLAAARDEDSVGRYGGEEFLVIVGDCSDVEIAAAIAERFRACLSCEPIQTTIGDLWVTCSLGVQFTNDARQVLPHELFEEADKALYEAKREGRNCVRVAGAESLCLQLATGMPALYQI